MLRWVRQQRGLSARGLSRRAGLTDSVAGKIESTTASPGLDTFARLVGALELSDREIATLVRLAAQQKPT
jgi:transcriptional regulator with XRE-family HTH domain